MGCAASPWRMAEGHRASGRGWHAWRRGRLRTRDGPADRHRRMCGRYPRLSRILQQGLIIAMSHIGRAAGAVRTAGILGAGLLAGALLPVGQARALPPLQCQDFVNFAMSAQAQYYSRGCARIPLMHANREGHFQWCLARNEGQVRADRDAKAAALQSCLVSGGPIGRQPSRPVAACNGLAGRYNGAASTITVAPGDRVRVTVGPNRPAGTGSCRGSRLTINFPDDRVISGIFDGRTIAWDNRTTWTKD